MKDNLATFLIFFMPVSAALKAFAFIVMTWVMYHQGSETPLAKWINRGFMAIMLSGLAGTWFTYYIADGADANDIHWPIEWALIISLNALPIWVAICYAMIVYHNYYDPTTETKNARDARQQETQEKLDAATLVLAETGKINADRGKRISLTGMELDKRIIRMAGRQHGQDKRRVAQDATDVRQDNREVQQDDRDKEE